MIFVSEKFTSTVINMSIEGCNLIIMLHISIFPSVDTTELKSQHWIQHCLFIFNSGKLQTSSKFLFLRLFCPIQEWGFRTNFPNLIIISLQISHPDDDYSISCTVQYSIVCNAIIPVCNCAKHSSTSQTILISFITNIRTILSRIQ